MKVLLDTNTCIFVIKRKPPEVLARFDTYAYGDVGVSSVTVSELYYGVEKSLSSERNRTALEMFLLSLVIAAFDGAAAKVCGKVRAELAKAGTPIGPFDSMIAAHALHLGVPIITNNAREFSRVRGLAVEDWTT